MKKKLILFSAAVILLSILGAGTLALFTAEGVAHNVITTSGVDIELVEKTLDPETGKEIPYPEGEVPVMPGETASKRVSVLNKDEEAWIRVRVVKEVRSAEEEELNADLIGLNIQSGWVEKDGYYYYTKPVATGESTPHLFTEVKFDGPGMDNDYQNCTISIAIFADAVQTANNPIPEGGDVTGVKGWPETQSLLRAMFD